MSDAIADTELLLVYSHGGFGDRDATIPRRRGASFLFWFSGTIPSSYLLPQLLQGRKNTSTSSFAQGLQHSSMIFPLISFPR
ncbi:uncharacterized protein LOC142814225 isoform X2 [Rhipicephalus microplus]|uniref:uncharacterized protein LOC142814225 isoform X2 n=1 Tax=Rhipicephalus microplus TaxID=6941 RepID=UPI003F6D3CCB